MTRSRKGGRVREPKGLLRINATLGFGRTTIAPIVSAFVKCYPAMEVQLQLTDRPLNLVEEGFDLGIRFGELPETRLHALKIMANERYLCATPAYLRLHGEPKTPDDLAHHRCIIHRQNDDAYGVWRLRKGKSTETVKIRGPLASNDGDVVLNWALDGHGILMRSRWDSKKYLESGRLKRLLADYALPPADLYVVYPHRHMSAKPRAFIDFLRPYFTAGARR